MEEIKNQKNYWPHAIIASIILIVIACIYTIIIALDNPVEMDSYYLEKYQKVDRNINDIIEKQKKFFDKYEVKYDFTSIKMDKPQTIALLLLDKKSNEFVKNANIFLLITRPDTNKFNQEYKSTSSKDGKYIFENIVVQKPGRWQFKAKIKSEDYEGFHEYEVNATK